MASQRRSIWEIRFYRLKELLLQKRDVIERKAGRMTLSEEITQQDVNNLNSRHQVVDELIEKAGKIETSKANRIFLERDFE